MSREPVGHRDLFHLAMMSTTRITIPVTIVTMRTDVLCGAGPVIVRSNRLIRTVDCPLNHFALERVAGLSRRVLEVDMTLLGDPYEAFATHVLPEIDALTRYARGLADQPADADDLLQDTLLRAFLAVGRFDGDHPRAWLLTILRNVDHNARRARRARPVAMSVLNGDERTAAPSAEQLVVDNILDATLQRAFRMLSESQRQVITLVDIQGFDYAETARLIDVPVGTVMSRLHRARNRIRSYLLDQRELRHICEEPLYRGADHGGGCGGRVVPIVDEAPYGRGSC
jgi:RNA polymerase sigma-70 factor, ECF subfamily